MHSGTGALFEFLLHGLVAKSSCHRISTSMVMFWVFVGNICVHFEHQGSAGI
jgi:hypothetical protein